MAYSARPKASEDSVSWVACKRNNLSLRNAWNAKISKWSMMKLGSRKNFKYLIQDNRRSFGKNHIYCPLQGHSTTDYVLSKALTPVFSTGFVSDNGCDREGGMQRMWKQQYRCACPGPAWLQLFTALDGGHMAGSGDLGSLLKALTSPGGAWGSLGCVLSAGWGCQLLNSKLNLPPDQVNLS